MNTTKPYDKLSIEEMLHIADKHTDPFVKAMAWQLDSAHYQLNIYRQMLGLPKPREPKQLDLFEGNDNG